MINLIRQLGNPTNKDLRKRVWFTLGVLLFYAIGTHIARLGSASFTKELTSAQLLAVYAGGGLQPHSIFGLGVAPYISASIIMQILQTDIIPYFKELKEQGYTGRQKLNMITRYLGIFLAFVQGYAFSFYFMKDAGAAAIMNSTIVLTGGTCLLIWLGDQISKKGIGNGLSLIIMAGILNTMPNMYITAFNTLISKGSNTWIGIGSFALYVIMNLAIIIGIVWVQLAERRIPIQYSNRTNSAYGGQQTYLPIKLNASGVMPVIFASSLLGVPAILAGFIENKGFVDFVNKYLTYTQPIGFIVYIVLIGLFGYFYTVMQMNPKEMAKNLNQNGGYIPGIRPGDDTDNYIKSIIKKISIFGTLFLIIIASTPIIFSKISNLPDSVTLGGTGLLIVVGVAIETYRQLESSIVSRSYKTKKRGRR